MKFAEFQNSETLIEWFVDCNRHLLEIETYEVVFEDANTLTLRFARQLLKLCCVGTEPCVGLLGLILAGLTIDRVLHEFEELFFDLRLGGGTEIGFLCDVGLEPARLLELDDAVDLRQLEPVRDVEFQAEVVCEIADLVEEAWK